MDETGDKQEGASQSVAEAPKPKKPKGIESPFADTTRQRSDQEILDLAKKKAEGAGKQIPEDEPPELQKIRQAKSHEARLKAREEARNQPVTQEVKTEAPQATKEIDPEKKYDVFFRDYTTGTPERLHRTVEGKVKGEKDTEPVILPQIPDNWIVKVPVGLGGSEAHYRLSKPDDAEEAKKKLSLGNITSSNREIMMLDAVHKDDVSKLEKEDYKVVPISEVPQRLGATEKTELPMAA